MGIVIMAGVSKVIVAETFYNFGFNEIKDKLAFLSIVDRISDKELSYEHYGAMCERLKFVHWSMNDKFKLSDVTEAENSILKTAESRCEGVKSMIPISER